jgi:hypothetical protein
MGDLAAAIEKTLPPAVPAGRDFGSTRIGEGSLSTGRAALFGQRRDCDPVPGSAASAKRISAERECEPVFFMTAARWFSTVRWLMNGGPAACEPHRRVDDSLLAVVDRGGSWTARQHLWACGGKSAIKTTPNSLLIALEAARLGCFSLTGIDAVPPRENQSNDAGLAALAGFLGGNTMIAAVNVSCGSSLEATGWPATRQS